MYAVVGHYTPTDAEIVDEKGESGVLDAYVSVALASTKKEAEALLDWYPDGVIVPVHVAAQ